MGDYLGKFKDYKFLLKFAGIAVVYYFSAKFGLNLSYSVDGVSLIWPASGVALASLIIFGTDLWPAIALGSFLSEFSAMNSIPATIALTAGSTLEPLIGAYLLKTFGFSSTFSKIKDVALFVVFGAMLSPIVNASIGASALLINGAIPITNLFSVWLKWWMGDLTGIMIVGTLLMVWSKFSKFKFNIFKAFEALLFFAIIIISSIALFTGTFPQISFAAQSQFKYLIFPLLIWASYRYKQKGSTLAVFLVSAISIWGVVTGSGPFIFSGNIEQSFLYLGFFALSTSITFLFFSEIIDERNNAEKRFKSIIENSTDVFILVDEKGDINYVSQPVKKILGFDPGELLGVSEFKIIHSDDVDQAKESFKTLLQNPGKTVVTEERVTLKNGDVHWMETKSVNLLDEPSVNAIIINFRDINERKELDLVKTEFISLSAHQLRSPLSVMRWYSESLGRESSLPEDVKDSVKEIHSSVLTMIDSINLLLDVSRFELGKVEVSAKPVEIDEILAKVLEEKEVAISVMGVQIVNTTAEKIPTITGDAKLIHVILDNLLSNAIKYSPKNGKIEVGFTVQPDNILFKIKDNGIGIPIKDQPKIFTKLYRASNVKTVQPGGLGLGLYLVRLIINLTGGKIWFESKGEGSGTTFFVEFPKDVRIKK